jgi:hypothetical protein
MSTRVTANKALVDAAAAMDEGSAAFLAAVGTTVGTKNTQLGTYTVKTTLGRTTANGGTVVATDPIPLAHSAEVRVTVIGRVVVAGATAAVGDTFTEVDLVAAKFAVSGGAQVGATVILAAQHDTSQASDTVAYAVGSLTGVLSITVTQNGAPNVGATIDWVIRTETLVD